MSKKFYNRLLTSTTIGSDVPFESSFGSSILKKFGWKEGSGLGRDEDGMKECLHIIKRPQNLGLGAKTGKNDRTNEWENWWEGLYDNVAKNIQIEQKQITSDEEDNTSDDEQNSLTLHKHKTYKITNQINTTKTFNTHTFEQTSTKNIRFETTTLQSNLISQTQTQKDDNHTTLQQHTTLHLQPTSHTHLMLTQQSNDITHTHKIPKTKKKKLTADNTQPIIKAKKIKKKPLHHTDISTEISEGLNIIKDKKKKKKKNDRL